MASDHIPRTDDKDVSVAVESQQIGSYDDVNQPSGARKDWRFWIIIVALSIVGTLGSLEGTVVSTALPTIIADLEGGNLYIWVVNAYFLTSTSLQPLYGQLSDILGRKPLILVAVAFFMLGSGISGGASSMTMLIAGRAVQGLGGGGVTMMIEVIVSDLVPVRERGTYMGIVLGACTIGTALGPVIGGLFVEYVTWRWAFWINLPIGAAAEILLVLFLRPTHAQKKGQRRSELLEIDVVGNALLVAAMSSILIALSYGGSSYSWSSYKVLVPLLVGLLGLGLWIGFEFSPLCKRPTVPIWLWTNRTSAISFINTFIQSLILNWAGYFLPVYFQGLHGSSPGRSGVQVLPTLFSVMGSGIVGGSCVQVLGRYKPFHLAGFALVTVGIGLFSLLDRTSSTGAWVGFQIIFGIGSGLTSSTLLQSAQAPFSDADNATVTAFWAFTRSFGYIWGVAISAAVFDNRTEAYAGSITDMPLRRKFEAGGGYQLATKAFVDSLAATPVTQSQVLRVFRRALRNLWQVCLAFGLAAFLLAIFEREIALRKTMDHTVSGEGHAVEGRKAEEQAAEVKA